MKYPTISAGLFACVLLANGALYSEDGGAPTYSLHSGREIGQIDQVNTVVEVTGNLFGKDDSKDSSKEDRKGEKTKKTTMSLVCKRDYDEKTLEVPDGTTKRWRSIRYYSQAAATLKVADSVTELALRPARRLLGVEVTPYKVTPFCPAGPLKDDELEVIGTVGGNNIPLDGLLPEGPVAIGQKWRGPDAILAVLLDLEEVTTNTVDTVLKEVTPDVARLELNGRVEGKRYGSLNRVELKAKCRFDRKAQRIDWFAMRVQQIHEAGVVEGGLDVVALLQMRISTKDASEPLGEAALKDVPLNATDALCRVEYESPEGGWRILHDRLWFQVEHHRDLDVFHRIDRGQDIALCKISPLPKAEPAGLVPLGQFQADVQQALGKNFSEFLEASQFTNDADYRVFRVIVKGNDGEIPARWHYYLVSDAEGHQVTFAFRMEEKRAEDFGKAGEQFAQSVRFTAARAKK